MQFIPKTEKQLEENRLLPESEYPFEVIEASDATSKSGKPMIKMKLNVYGRDRQAHIYDYISDVFMEHKLRHFCFAVGLGSAYEAGTLTARQCLGRQGYATISLEDGKDGFRTKNVIFDYVIPASEAPPEPPAEIPLLPVEPSAIENADVPVASNAVPEEDPESIPF